jgi:hypothetical protein
LLRHGFLNHRMNGLNPCGCESTLLTRYKDDVWVNSAADGLDFPSRYVSR